MMDKQLQLISGTPLDAVVLSTDTKALESRIPYVGQRVEFDDGRVFRFCVFNEVITVGTPVAQRDCMAEIAGGCTAASAGATAITINTTATTFFGGAAGVLAANRLAGGMLHIVDDDGEGYNYKIKSNTAGTSLVSVVFTLYEPGLIVAITVNTDVVLTANKYRYPIAGTATLNPLGVIKRTSTGGSSTVDAYVWVQTRGPVTALGTGTLGTPCSIGAGVVEAMNAATDNPIGCCLATSANGHVAIDLNIE